VQPPCSEAPSSLPSLSRLTARPRNGSFVFCLLKDSPAKLARSVCNLPSRGYLYPVILTPGVSAPSYCVPPPTSVRGHLPRSSLNYVSPVAHPGNVEKCCSILSSSSFEPAYRVEGPLTLTGYFFLCHDLASVYHAPPPLISSGPSRRR